MTLVHLIDRNERFSRYRMPRIAALAYFAWHDRRGTCFPRWMDYQDAAGRAADLRWWTLSLTAQR